MKHKQQKKPTLKNKKKQTNQCQSGSTCNPRSPNASRNYYNMQKKSQQLSKKSKFPYATMHENLKVVLNISIRNRYVVGFKTKEDVGQILAPLDTDDYEGMLYEEY